MKVLQLSTSLSFAGAEQIILDLCSMKNKSFVIAGLQSGDGSFLKKAELLGLKCYDLKMKAKWDLAVIKRLKKIIKEEKIALIHSHLVHANFIGRLAASQIEIPIISTIHIVEKRFRPSHTLMERLTSSKADRISCVSQCVYEHARDRIKLPEDKLVLIPNGIDTRRFKSSKEPRDIDVLILGRLDEQKGIDQVLPSLKEASEKSTLRIVIVGTGPKEKELKLQAEELGLRVEWMGFSNTPETWMSQSKVCLIPSRWEGFGLVAAEALASGCRVIHSGVDSLNSVCGDHAEIFFKR